MSVQKSRNRLTQLWIFGSIFLLTSSVLSIKFGQVPLSWDDIIAVFSGQPHAPIHRALLFEIRIPRILTSMVASALLAMSGLLIQNLFRNPLAGPSILGITSGSSLGVALMTMASGALGMHMDQLVQWGAIPLAAFLGAFSVLIVVLLVSRRMADHQSLLIFGVMLGYFTSALITALQYKANADNIRTFVMWGMGSFAEVQMHVFCVLLVLLLLSWILVRRKAMALNCFLLGDTYAQSMGVDVRRLRWQMIALCGVQVGLVTAYCGPVAFIGLTVPILARMTLQSSDHRYTISAVVIMGLSAGLFSDQLAQNLELPLNAITAALGAPMVIWLLLKTRKGHLSL